MLIGLLLDNDPICLSCAHALRVDELARALPLRDDDAENLGLACARCADMLVDYAGLLDDDDLRRMQASTP